MAYATYEYYTNTYHGNILTQDQFNTLSERATDYISAYTYGRSDGTLTNEEETLVKKCTCAVSEVLSECGVSALSTGEKSSERVGNWSVSYASGGIGNMTGDIVNTVVLNKVRLYLWRTRLMYMGVDL